MLYATMDRDEDSKVSRDEFQRFETAVNFAKSYLDDDMCSSTEFLRS